MSRWRREASRLFPERREYVERVPTVEELFWMLEADARACLTAGGPPWPNHLEHIFEFAVWCLSDQQHESLREAARTRFFLHLGALPDGREALAATLSATQLRGMLEGFYSRLPEEAFEELRATIVATFPELAGDFIALAI